MDKDKVDLYLSIYEQAKNKSFDNPKWFFDHILCFQALEWQIKAINVVFDVRRKALGIPTIHNHEGLPRLSIRSCHGTGKTQFLAMLMHIWNFVLYGKIACTAPKEAQLTKRLLPRYRGCMKNADKTYKNNIEVQGKEVKIFGDPDWGSVMETASDPDNLAGYHDNPQLFLVDEASAKRLDPMFPVIEGALTTAGSVIVEIGNPTRVEGEFFNHHNKEGVKNLYYLMHIKYTDAEKLISREWVKTMAAKYGTNSPIYLIRVAGEFAAYDEYTLIPSDFIENAFDVEDETDGSHPILKISIDVADGGADSTTITVAKHYESKVHVLKQKAFWFEPSKSVIDSAKAAINMFEAYGGNKVHDVFIVDAIGVGAGTAGYLMDCGYNVVRNIGGETSDDSDRWRNRRVQNYMCLYDYYINNKITIEPDAIDDEEEYRAHILSIKRAEGSEKVDDIQTKKQIKANGLPSPDRADSMAMQFNGVYSLTLSAPLIEPVMVGQSMNSGYDGGLI